MSPHSSSASANVWPLSLAVASVTQWSSARSSMSDAYRWPRPSRNTRTASLPSTTGHRAQRTRTGPRASANARAGSAWGGTARWSGSSTTGARRASPADTSTAWQSSATLYVKSSGADLNAAKSHSSSLMKGRGLAISRLCRWKVQQSRRSGRAPTGGREHRRSAAERLLDPLGQRRTDPFDLRELFGVGTSDRGDRSEVLDESPLERRAHALDVIESASQANACRDACGGG